MIIPIASDFIIVLDAVHPIVSNFRFCTDFLYKKFIKLLAACFLASDIFN